MLTVVPLVSLTDRQPARLIYLASSMLSALSCVGVALCDSLLPALGFRAAARVALAGMYMPRLQALTHGPQVATVEKTWKVRRLNPEAGIKRGVEDEETRKRRAGKGHSVRS